MRDHLNFYRLITNKQDPRHGGGAIPITLGECTKYNEDKYDIFWTMNGFDFGKRSRADLKYINCFYADLDTGDRKEMEKRIRNYPTPSCIVKTGKGYHLYWWLDEEIDVQKDPEKGCDWFREFTMQRIVPALQSDPQAADACRLLRATFYRYWKDGIGDKHIDIVESNDRKFGLNYLEKYFPQKIVEEKKIIYPKMEGGSTFWSKANALPITESLEKLSGTHYVQHETFSIKKGRILCNNKTSNAWIDKNGRIGSTADAGPFVPNWLWYYHKDWKKVASILKEVFPELGE